MFPGVLDYLRSRHGDHERHYHNWRHIASMLLQCDACESLGQIHNPDAVKLAIYFHDAVYDPKARDNESRSAQLMDRMMDMLPDSVRSTAYALILATEKHELPSWSEPKANDARLFLDMDLSILGSTPAEYENYQKAIRAEYNFVPTTEFAQARVEVLRRFLSRPRIFFSDIYYAAREKQARENIQREIDNLSMRANIGLDGQDRTAD